MSCIISRAIFQIIKNFLKASGLEIVGYARKSPAVKYSNEKVETRKRLLEAMVSSLKNRSLVTKVFVSWSSLANEAIAKRDLKKTSGKVSSCSSNTQDMLQYFQDAKQDISFGMPRLCRLVVQSSRCQTIIRKV